MKTRLFILSLVIFLYSTAANAQNVMFRVLASKGANKVQINGTGALSPLYAGKKLNSGDKITVPADGYLGLAHTSGKTIELKKAGTYEVAKLATVVSAQNSSTAKKYADYLAGELNKTDGEDMAKNRYKYMSATGSVVRGTDPIKILTPEKVNVLGNSVFLKWEKADNVKTYVIEVANMFGDKVLTKETTDASIIITLDSKKDKDYVWVMYSKDDISKKTEGRSIKILTDDKATELKKQVAELNSSLGEESALSKVVLASFYEDNKLYADAMQAYEEATKLEPEVDDFKIQYGQFMERANIAEPKKTEAK